MTGFTWLFDKTRDYILQFTVTYAHTIVQIHVFTAVAY
jgi:hypothetical protein